MRKRGYLIVVGLCGLGLLAPAVAGADVCTDEQPVNGIVGIGPDTLQFKAVCKGVWTVQISTTTEGEKLTVEASATEDNTGKECNATMVTPTGGLGDFAAQEEACKFTKDQRVKMSFKKK
jgi:hypothetical protein